MVRNQGEETFYRGKVSKISEDHRLNGCVVVLVVVDILPGEVDVRLNSLAPRTSYAVKTVAPIVTIVL